MFLEKIVKHKKQELAERKGEVPLDQIKQVLRPTSELRDFKGALTQEGLGLIAEIKQASPSKGLIREDFDPVAIAKNYSANQVAAISILTDEKFFQGSLDYLRQVRAVTELPLLRKDFIIDPYQVYEAQAAGADAILLIVNILSPEQLAQLLNLADQLGLAVLVEVHTAQELAVAQEVGAEIIGINNRDLVTFETDIKQTLQLQGSLSEEQVIISESGISTRSDIELLAKAGIDGVLVGETLMRSSDLGAKIDRLLGRSEHSND
ncbi:MAG: indole-3-glycerol phosphate synthase TrpC [Bacillota bacterium]